MDILLGVGGSELSYQALEETLDRVRETGDDLTVAIFNNEEISEESATIRQRVEATLQEHDFEADIRELEGDSPGSDLISLAENEGFDRIVLGGGERSTLGKIQLGSIVEFVLLNAQTPVTLIR
jgi:nucleotide-binding universal stress UspA family protein